MQMCYVCSGEIERLKCARSSEVNIQVANSGKASITHLFPVGLYGIGRCSIYGYFSIEVQRRQNASDLWER